MRHPLLTSPVAPPAAAAESDTARDVPSAPVLLSATLSLMTAWADAGPDAGVAHARPGAGDDALDRACRRSLLARKLVSNLWFLMHHPDVPPPMRQVMAQQRQRWLMLSEAPVRSAGEAVH